MAQKVEDYLSEKKNSIKDSIIAEHFQTLEKLYVKKLWNQITEETLKFVNDTKFAQVVDLKDFYDNFIREFELRINSLKLILIVIPIAKQICKYSGSDEAINFLCKFEKIVAKSLEATVRLIVIQTEFLLEKKNSFGACQDIEAVRKKLDITQKKLDEISGVTEVHAAFYKVSAIYYKEIGDHAVYYREALRYLGCEDFGNISAAEKHLYATYLGFAALLGKDVYNFGELLAHPILQSLKNTEEEWLLDLLLAFNSGQVDKFYLAEPRWSRFPDLVKKKSLLETKIRLLCLMELGVSRPPKKRQISFTEIAKSAQIELPEVEFLVMKALSLDLIHGSIDEVNATINVSWIQPRVLTTEQILHMADRINLWRKDVQDMEEVVSEEAKEILMRN